MFRRGSAFAATIAGTLLWTWSAWGQVAAPSLTPFDFVPENPAVMSWGSPSRIGTALAQAQAITEPVAANAIDNFNGVSDGIRLVGRSLAAAAEYTYFWSVSPANNMPSEFVQDTKVALSLRLGSILALGVGQTNQSSQMSQLGDSFGDNAQIPQVGLSLRLGEWLFLGGAAGQDYVSHKDSATPQNDFNTSHDVFKYGAGIRTAGTLITHLEYYVVDFQDYANTHLAQSGRETSRTGVAEFIFRDFLLGYVTTHTDLDSNQPATDTERLDFGYAPTTGFTVVGRGQSDVRKFPQPSRIGTISTTTYYLLITYLFTP